MRSLLLKWFVILFLVLGLGGAATLGYLYIKLRKERDVLVGQTNDLNTRVRLLQKKYADEKARAEGLERTRLALEGKIRAAQEEIETLNKDKESLLAEKKRLGQELEDMEKGSADLRVEMEELLGRYEEFQVECSETKSTLTQRIKDLDRKKTELIGEKERLELELDRTKRGLKRCASNNAQLCIIANELVDAYEDKGVVGSLLQKEPFIQLKKVEIEKFSQEYREKIDGQQIKRGK
jgi:chromosome segregation ATPase